MEDKNIAYNKVNRLAKMASIFFWLLIWYLASRIIHMELILPSPLEVLKTLGELSLQKNFWYTIMLSSLRITFGFILALLLGTGLAIMSYKYSLFEIIIDLPIKLIKVTPIASFVLLALLWVNGSNLSILIAFMMVLPIIYTNILTGLRKTDAKLLEMSKIFRVSKMNVIRKIYIPSILPYLSSAIKVGVGFCWKAGVAAEVIGIPRPSIGFNLYQAKLYLMTKEVMAWTIVIIVISIIFEKIIFYLMEKFKWVNI